MHEHEGEDASHQNKVKEAFEKPSSHAETFKGGSLLVAALKDRRSSTGFFSGFLATLARLIVCHAPISPHKLDFL